MTQHDIINIITITTSLVALIILIYFYPKIKSSTKTYNDAKEIINLIIKELIERLNEQDLKISDQIPLGKYTIDATFIYLACDPTKCIPKFDDFSFIIIECFI